MSLSPRILITQEEHIERIIEITEGEGENHIENRSRGTCSYRPIISVGKNSSADRKGEDEKEVYHDDEDRISRVSLILEVVAANDGVAEAADVADRIHYLLGAKININTFFYDFFCFYT